MIEAEDAFYKRMLGCDGGGGTGADMRSKKSGVFVVKKTHVVCAVIAAVGGVIAAVIGVMPHYFSRGQQTTGAPVVLSASLSVESLAPLVEAAIGYPDGADIFPDTRSIITRSYRMVETNALAGDERAATAVQELIQDHRWDGALAYLKVQTSSGVLDDDLAELLFGQAILEMSVAGDMVQAVAALRRTHDLDQMIPMAVVLEAHLILHGGRAHQAMEFIADHQQLLIDAGPAANVAYQILLARCHSLIGRDDLAVACLEMGLSISKDRKDLFYEHALIGIKIAETLINDRKSSTDDIARAKELIDRSAGIESRIRGPHPIKAKISIVAAKYWASRADLAHFAPEKALVSLQDAEFQYEQMRNSRGLALVDSMRGRYCLAQAFLFNKREEGRAIVREWLQQSAGWYDQSASRYLAEEIGSLIEGGAALLNYAIAKNNLARAWQAAGDILRAEEAQSEANEAAATAIRYFKQMGASEHVDRAESVIRGFLHTEDLREPADAVSSPASTIAE